MQTEMDFLQKTNLHINIRQFFPEKLVEDHIYSWSNQGDIVLDPFGCIGTTAKMAETYGPRLGIN
jgi:site-specific DNA-methyltransferase (adenine-specific)